MESFDAVLPQLAADESKEHQDRCVETIAQESTCDP